MPNWVVFVGLGLLTFALMAAWLASAAMTTFKPTQRSEFYMAAAFCVALTVFFLAVDGARPGHQPFG
jgi:hypothetical protein